MVKTWAVEANRSHAVQLAPRLRQADVLEITRSTGLSVREGLVQSVELSFSCHAFLMDGQVEVLLGLARTGIMFNTGIPWMLMSDEPLKHKGLISKFVPKVIEYWQSLCDYMENYVDADNEVAVQWLNRIGFTVDEEPVPFGVAQTPFHRFEWRRDV